MRKPFKIIYRGIDINFRSLKKGLKGYFVIKGNKYFSIMAWNNPNWKSHNQMPLDGFKDTFLESVDRILDKQ